MGPSGSGKSTILNICAGLVQADSGLVEVMDQDLTSLSAGRRAQMRLTHLGVVFQDHNLIDEFTALENVMLPLLAQGYTKDEARREAQGALARLSVEELSRRRPTEMSGGQGQRVGIARALAGTKSVLVADEPTGSLDSANTAEVFRALFELAQQGVAVIAATHDRDVERYCSRTLEVVDGHLEESQ